MASPSVALRVRPPSPFASAVGVVHVVRDFAIRDAQKTHAPLTTMVKGVITSACALRDV
jgi:hypothetical protein